MKIVHIGLSLVTDGWNYQDNLLPKYHSRMGLDVTYISSRYIWGSNGKIQDTKRTNYVNGDGVRMIRLQLKGFHTYKSKFKRLKGLSETLITISPDIIFVHGCQFVDIKVIVKYVKMHPDVAVYVDNHADFSNSAKNIFSKYILHKIIWKHCAKKIEPYTYKFYGTLPARVDFLVDMYKIPKNKVELLLMGVDDELAEKVSDLTVKEEFRKSFNISVDEFLIVTGGKIDIAKYQTLLLMKAVRNICNCKVKLIVFGPVVDELIDEFNSLLDNDRIIYINWLSWEQSYLCLAASDLVVFPGRHSVYWEQAVGLGVPCVFKWWEGTTHIDLGGNCIFLYYDSAEEIQTVIEEILEKPNRLLRMKDVAKEKGMKKFSYREIAHKSVKI